MLGQGDLEAVTEVGGMGRAVGELRRWMLEEPPVGSGDQKVWGGMVDLLLKWGTLFLSVKEIIQHRTLPGVRQDRTRFSLRTTGRG